MPTFRIQASRLPTTYNAEYRHKRLIARPDELLVSKRRKRVILRLAPRGDNPRRVSDLDQKVAELTSWVVAKSYWRVRFLGYQLYTYLAYPGPCQVEIEPRDDDVKRDVSRLLAKGSDLPPAIPVPVAAYCLLQDAHLEETHQITPTATKHPGISDELAARRQILRG